MCDVDEAVVEAGRRREFDVAGAHDRLRRLLERDDIDVIDVVTGDSGHFELTMAALEVGKHVLVEKPVAHDFRDTLRARDLAAVEEPEDEGRLQRSATARRSGTCAS